MSRSRIGIYETGKLFVGGLSWGTTQDKLQNYFSKFGKIIDCVVLKNHVGRSRGFGFVTFADPKDLYAVLENQHCLDGRFIDAKLCNSREFQERQNLIRKFPKVFLGGLPTNVTEADVREAFSRYGNVVDVLLMYDYEQRRGRGFGFISFDSYSAIIATTAEHFIAVNGKYVEVKKIDSRASSLHEQECRQATYGNGLSTSFLQYQNNQYSCGNPSTQRHVYDPCYSATSTGTQYENYNYPYNQDIAGTVTNNSYSQLGVPGVEYDYFARHYTLTPVPKHIETYDSSSDTQTTASTPFGNNDYSMPPPDYYS